MAELSDKANLPLSFIQADSEVKLDLEFSGGTVREALDAIVDKAAVYRYGLVSGRLVLYPRDPKWQTRIENLRIGPAPRIQAARDLAKALSPQVGDLGGPWILGDSRAYTYQDVVEVAGPGTVLELLVQLLGDRRSTFVLLVKKDGWLGPSLSVSSRDQLEALRLSAPVTVLKHRNETVQLKLRGTLAYGALTRDLTLNACRTVYTVSDETVLTVSPDGLVTAHRSGEAIVKASNEHFSDEMTIKVELPEEKPKAVPGPGQMVSGRSPGNRFED